MDILAYVNAISKKKRDIEFSAQPLETSHLKFARQKSKLGGRICGSFFVIKGEY